MRAREIFETKLFEGPYDMEDDYRPIVKLDSYPSRENLERLCDHLGDLHKDGKVFSFWFMHTGKVAKVTTSAIDDIGQMRELVVSQIRFDNRAFIPNLNKPLQVEMAFTHPNYQSEALAASMYLVLTRYGFNIVSDYTQYNGGKAIWKKLARESNARKCCVRVWSDKLSDWLRDDTNNIIKYDGNNLDDETIWDSIFSQVEQTSLFVLSAK